jgi:hypothetical protein
MTIRRIHRYTDPQLEVSMVLPFDAQVDAEAWRRFFAVQLDLLEVLTEKI